MKLTVNSPESKSAAIKSINDEYQKHHYLRITVLTGKHRSVQMNALSWTWYQQVSIERGEMTPQQAHTFCKLHFGVPILRRDSEEFADTYDANIKSLDYDVKMHIISLIPISSTFTTNQFKEYMEEVREHFGSLPTDPVQLLYPDDLD